MKQKFISSQMHTWVGASSWQTPALNGGQEANSIFGLRKWSKLCTSGLGGLWKNTGKTKEKQPPAGIISIPISCISAMSTRTCPAALELMRRAAFDLSESS